MQVFPSQFQEHIRSAILGALEGSAATIVSEAQQMDWVSEWPDEMLTVILGFECSEIQGSLIICCEDQFLRSSCPGLSTLKDFDESVLLTDWLGELSNLTTGRIKASMLNHGVEMRINPPSVMESPTSILESYAERMPSTQIWVEVSGHKACFQVGAFLQNIDFSKKPEEVHLGPGAAVLEMNPLKRKPRSPLRTVTQSEGEMEGTGLTEGLGHELMASVTGVSLVAKQLLLTFTGGMKLAIDLAAHGTRGFEVSLNSQNLSLKIEDGGYLVEYADLQFFLPVV